MGVLLRSGRVRECTDTAVRVPACAQPKSRQVVDVAPTVGFNVEEFQRG